MLSNAFTKDEMQQVCVSSLLTELPLIKGMPIISWFPTLGLILIWLLVILTSCSSIVSLPKVPVQWESSSFLFSVEDPEIIKGLFKQYYEQCRSGKSTCPSDWIRFSVMKIQICMSTNVIYYHKGSQQKFTDFNLYTIPVILRFALVE